jgi:hypothetical protein
MKLTTHKHTAESSAEHRKALREKKLVEQIRLANAAAVHREGDERIRKRGEKG